MTWEEFKNDVEKRLDEKGISHNEEIAGIDFRGGKQRVKKLEHDVFYGIYIN